MPSTILLTHRAEVSGFIRYAMGTVRSRLARRPITTTDDADDIPPPVHPRSQDRPATAATEETQQPVSSPDKKPGEKLGEKRRSRGDSEDGSQSRVNRAVPSTAVEPSKRQAKKRRSRGESEDRSPSHSCALLLLPGETLHHVLSYTLPDAECQTLEHIGMLSGVCRRFRSFAVTAAPKRLCLHQFGEKYPALLHRSTRDKRARLLRALLRHSWMRQNLEEFHVSCWSVLENGGICHTIRCLLRDLLSLPGAFPSLIWLDINLQCNDIFGYQGVDGALLQHMPSAMPSLERLCLVACFPFGNNDQEEQVIEITPDQWTDFFRQLRLPLKSLSLGYVRMTDEHVKAFMPVVGRGLERLELTKCYTYNHFWDEEDPLNDDSAIAVATNCTKLTSLTFAESYISTSALRCVLAANTGIRKLDLSSSDILGSDTVEVIAQHLPHLTEFRNYWPRSGGMSANGEDDWLSNSALKSLCDLNARSNGGVMSLLFLGLCDDEYKISEGIMYAVRKGLKTIEIRPDDDSNRSLRNDIENSGAAVVIQQPTYPFHIDGSQMNWSK